MSTENWTPATTAALLLALSSSSSSTGISKSVLDSSSKWTLLRRSRRSKFLTIMTTGPITIIRDWPVQRSVQYNNIPQAFDLFQMSDDWCLEFLRFTKKQVCEMTYLLNIPEKFPDKFTCPPTTALALVCYRLAWPHRLKDCIMYFGHGKSWLSTIFNHTCIHIARQFQEIQRWNDHHLTPSQLSRYCAKIQERGEPSGLVWGFIDGTHKQTCRPRPETVDQEELYSGHKHMHSMQFLAVVTPDGLISCLDGPYEGRKGD